MQKEPEDLSNAVVFVGLIGVAILVSMVIMFIASVTLIT